MFCPNCGNKISENQQKCLYCGTLKEKILNLEKNNTDSSYTETLSKQLMKNNPFKPIFRKIKKTIIGVKFYILKHKKVFFASFSVGLFFFLFLVLFNTFFDFTQIYWDQENGDYHLNYTTEGTTLHLNVLAYDKEKNPITDITFETDRGITKTDGANVSWELPKEAGQYTIIASSPSGKKIKKTVQVVSLPEENGALLSPTFELVDDENADTDMDGLTNGEEKKFGTNPYFADTDHDGLSDYYEIYISKTDPLNADSDSDGLRDGDEIDLGLDPLKSDSFGDGIKDGDRILTYKTEFSKYGVSLEIEGSGNIASTTVDVFSNPSFLSMDGFLSQVYNFYTEGTIKSATVKIHYDLKEVLENGLEEDNLQLYYFNEKTKSLEAIPTTVDKENQQIVVTLNLLAKYVIGPKSQGFSKYRKEIMFVIDNSVSMYSTEQMIDAGYNESTGAIGNDTSFKRFSLTNRLIDMLTGTDYSYGVAEFSGNYVKLQNFSSDKEVVKSVVNSMKSNWKSNARGTNIVSALQEGIKEFSSTEADRYLLLLTDGKNTEGSLNYNKSTIISNVKSKNTKICIIGLGDDIDSDILSEIATSSGCHYYNASSDSALDEIYKQMIADIYYNYADTDNDNTVDGMILANSGFLVNRDGFSFKNFSSNKSEGGHCYGMALFALLYYQKELPNYLDALTLSSGFLNLQKWSSNGYDLRNTYFSKGKNLYDFKITNEALSYFFGNLPADYRDEIVSGVWTIKKEYFEKLTAIGATIIEKTFSGDADFSKFQTAILNIDNDTFNNLVSKDEAQVLNAIWRLFILQQDDDSISFSTNPDRAFDKLLNNLSYETPSVLGMYFKDGGHAVNALRLIQDLDNANKFKIEIYDNNYPGETRYIDVTRIKYSDANFFDKVTIQSLFNEYLYTFSYDFDNDGNVEELSMLDIRYADVR